jgi:hypothetical protein
MKKNLLLLTLTFILFIPQLYAGSYQAKNIDIRYQFSPDTGDISPITRYPFYLDKEENIYLAIEYGSSSSTGVETESQNNTFDKMSLSLDKQEASIVLGYDWKLDNILLSPEISGDYISIDKNQFGYAINNDGYKNSNNPNGDLFFDNEVSIDILRARFGLTLSGNFEHFGFSLQGIIYPWSNLDVEQSLLIRPLVDQIGEANSSNELDMSYEARLNFFIKFNEDWTIVALGEYKYLPLKYNTITYKRGVGLIEVEESDTNEEFTGMLKLVTPLTLSGDARLSFGIGQRINRTDGLEKEKDFLFSFGVDSTF